MEYEELNLLGRGAYGRVVRARRVSDGLICVIKQVPL